MCVRVCGGGGGSHALYEGGGRKRTWMPRKMILMAGVCVADEGGAWTRPCSYSACVDFYFIVIFFDNFFCRLKELGEGLAHTAPVSIFIFFIYFLLIFFVG